MPRRLPVFLALLAALVVVGLGSPVRADADLLSGIGPGGVNVVGTDDDDSRAMATWNIQMPRRCRGEGYGEYLRPQVGRRTRTSFSIRRTQRAYDVRSRLAVVSVIRAAGSLRRHPRMPRVKRWVGHVRASMKVRRGRSWIRCRLVGRWRAAREAAGGGRMTVASEPIDGPGERRSWSFDNSNALMTGSGDNRYVRLGARSNAAGHTSWGVDFEAPKGETFTVGRTYSAGETRSLEEDGAGLEIRGNGCRTVGGGFTVTGARFDRRGRMLSFSAAFVGSCQGTGPARAAHGTVTFRSALSD